jgi:DNA-binding MarR family transcriptional regulator
MRRSNRRGRRSLANGPPVEWRDGLASWQAAVRRRREVERGLGQLGLTLIQWLVLDAAATLVRERRDAVSQSEIGRRVEIDRATLSVVMLRLAQRGLVDRDIDATGASYRIYVTDSGNLAVEQGRARIRSVDLERVP